MTLVLVQIIVAGTGRGSAFQLARTPGLRIHKPYAPEDVRQALSRLLQPSPT
jgi:hypothetical protein